MKYLKMLGLAVVAAMAFAAFLGAGSASATVLCTTTPTTGTHCGEAWKLGSGAVLDASVEDTAKLDDTDPKNGTIDTCSGGTVKGSLAAGWTGDTTHTPTGAISELTWSGCTRPTTTLAKGSLEVHHITGTDNGTVTSTGSEVTINIAGITCTFGTSNTDIGTLTGGNPATFDIEAVINRVAGVFCPTHGVWSGHYKVTTPSGTLHVTAG